MEAAIVKYLKSVIALFLSIVAIGSTALAGSIDVTADIVIVDQKLPGTIHKDGSYQFSAGELEKLKEFISTQKSSRSSISPTYADMLSFAAPEYYSTFPDDDKDHVESIPFNSEISSTRGTEYGWYNNWVTISKYGASLYSEAGVDRPYGMAARPDHSNVKVNVDCFLYRSADNELMEYSYNDKTFAFGQYIGVVTASLYAEPPTGSYKTVGNVCFPVHEDPSSLIVYYSQLLQGSPISYVNPY